MKELKNGVETDQLFSLILKIFAIAIVLSSSSKANVPIYGGKYRQKLFSKILFDIAEHYCHICHPISVVH